MLLRYTILLISICFSLLSFGQDATLYGIVRDSLGEPQRNVRIVATDISGNKEQTTDTRRDGSYKITIPANKAIIFEFGGNLNYESKVKQFKLNSGEQREYNITIGIEEEKSVVIRDNRVFLELVKPPDLKRMASTSGNFEDFLKVSGLGVSSNNELSSTYNVRGGNYDENLIYVNDIEIYRPFLVRSGQQEGLSFIHSDLVENIQFSAGGFDAKYGDKLSSVLDIKYRQPTDTRASITLSFMGANTHFEGRSKNRKFTYLVGARYRNNSYVLNSLQTQGDYRPEFADAQTYLSWMPTEDFSIDVLAHYSSNKFRVVPENRETAFGPINEALKFTVFFDGQEITQFNTYTGAVSLNFRPTKNTRFKWISSAFRSIETEKFDIQGQYWLDEIETDLGSEEFGETTFNRGVGTFLNHARNRLDATVFNSYIKANSRLNDRHELFYGAKFQHEIFTDRISEWSLLDSAGFSIPQAPSDEIQLDELIKANLSLQSNRYSAYVQDIYTLSSSKLIDFEDSTFMSPAYVRIAAGVRSQWWEVNEQLTISPRAKISYSPRWYYYRNDTLIRRDAEIKFAVGVYHQPPLYRALRTFDGSLNQSVLAQQSVHFVFGGHYTFDMWDRPFKLTSELYYKILTDINQYEIDNVRIRYHAENKASGYATGIDFKLNGEFVRGVESWAKLSFMRTREDINNDFYYDFYNSDGELIFPGYSINDVAVDSVRIEPGYIPRPADQFMNLGLYFQDRMPRWPSYKVTLTLLFGTGLPYGPPDHDRYKDILRTTAYRRLDIGFLKDLLTNRERLKPDSFWHNVSDMWISLEIFNIANINNTISYTWIKDVNNLQNPVPNFLTGRRINLKYVCKF